MKREWLFLCLLMFLAGRLPGEQVDSTELIFNDAVVHRFELLFADEAWSDSLEYNKEVANEEYMSAAMLYRTPDGDSIVLDSIGVRYKGNSSYELAKNTPKKSFKFRFDKYKDGQTFFGCERLNFNNCVLDPSFLREKISYDIAREFMEAPRVAFATITINGSLIGLYAQVEQVDELFLERHFSDPDGNLYKAGDNGAYLEYNGANQSAYEQAYELKTNTGTNNWSRFITMIYKLNNTPDSLFVQTVGAAIDLDRAVKHLAWTMLLSHFDSYTGSGRNYYLYDDPGSGRFTIIPWDLNLSFGQYANSWDVIRNNVVTIENLDKRPLNRRILENDSLRDVYFGYLRTMMTGKGSLDSLSDEVDRLKAVIDEAVAAEPEENAFYTYEDFEKNTDSNLVIREGLKSTTIWGIKAFTAARNAELAAQIEAGVTSPRAAGRTSGVRLRSSFQAHIASVVIDFNLPASSGFPAELTITNCLGREVYHTALPVVEGQGHIRWSTGNTASGAYAVTISNRTMDLTDRVVITR
ncbi:MAG: CotH kinase family protein [Chitinispirillaceae bacterium]|nr:CotH kinase family protein [Chitinispirillaceae bacterium]